jgi:transposase
VGLRRDWTWVLGLPGFRVERIEGQAAESDSLLRVFIERRGRRYPCSGCGERTSRVRSAKERTWDDLSWAAHPVTLIYRQRRVRCRRCGVRTEQVEFADARARVTLRLRQQIGVDCQSMPTSHAAMRYGVSWGKARRAEKAFLADWDRTRVKRQPRHIGLDEIRRGKGQRFWTVLSDVVQAR